MTRRRPEPLQSLTAFQRDLFRIVAQLDAPNGQDVLAEIEDVYSTDINHGRLYPNLNGLVEEGLVDKERRSRTENAYTLSEDGEAAYLADVEWRVRAVED